jgi:hypothetical protein
MQRSRQHQSDAQTRLLVALYGRYPHLTHQKLPRLPRTERYFIALNLYNSRSNGILEALSDELLRLAYVVGKQGAEGVIDPDNMFVSIYEVRPSSTAGGGAARSLCYLAHCWVVAVASCTERLQ